MRHANKEIKDTAIIEHVLNTAHVGRLGSITREGWPMVKPLNFVYINGAIYFHTATEGEKIDDIRRDSRVCFEVDMPVALVKSKSDPCLCEYLYRSVIIKGRAELIEAESERKDALSALMKKYQPEGGYGGFSPEKLKITGVVRIDIVRMTGKEDLGKAEVKEAAVKAIESGETLPVVIWRQG